jgi:hypothetical protein
MVRRKPPTPFPGRAAAGPALAIFLLGLFACGGDRERPVPQSYRDAAAAIQAKGLAEEGAFVVLARLTETVGPRLPGSPAAEAAVALMRAEMERLGFETWLEPTTVQHWERGDEETGRIVRSKERVETPLTLTALGGSTATPPSGITARVLETTSFEDLRARASEARDKIVFFNRAMDRTSIDAFRAYGEAARFRAGGAAEAARLGATAVLVRSATQRLDDFPHTGMLQYVPGVPEIPAAAVSTLSAEILSAALAEDPGLEVSFRQNPRRLPDVVTANVIGQVRGLEKPDEIVLLGAHLDSWDLGTGAHDDGAGCAQAIEALRLIQSLGLRPKRTVRAVLFMNEEFGASGGRDYARADRRAREGHVAAMESDRGGFLPLGFGVGGGSEALRRIRRWEPLLRPAGILWIGPGGGGADIGPIVEAGALAMGFVPNSQTYFDVHHSGLDVLARVHPRELELGAIVLAIMAYVMAEEGA